MNAIVSPYYDGDNRITIMQVNNGWVVNMPMDPPSFEEDQFKSAVLMGAAMNKEIHKDPLLEELAPTEIKVPEQFKRTPTPFKDKKVPNVHVFATWAEVIEFLKDKA